MIKILFTIGNALLTIGSVLSLGKRAAYFTKRGKYHHRPTYTKPTQTKSTQTKPVQTKQDKKS